MNQRHIVYHSADLQEPLLPSTFIYFARSGLSFDGHSFAQKVIESGNDCVGNPSHIERLYKSSDAEKILNSPYFHAVNDVENALNQALDDFYKVTPNDFFSVGVTGTNGKTSVVQMLSQLFSLIFGQESVRMGTLGIQLGSHIFPGSHVTTPDYPTFIKALNYAKQKNVSLLLMEATSHGLKENRLPNWLFDVAIFTNFSQDHLDYHKTMDDYLESKKKLFSEKIKQKSSVVLSLASPYWIHFLGASSHAQCVIGVGSTNCKKDFDSQDFSSFERSFFIEASSIINSAEGLSASLLFYQNGCLIEQCNMICPLVGLFQLENILLSLGALVAFFWKHSLQMSFSHFVEMASNALAKLQTIPGRLELLSLPMLGISIPRVFIDYAHSPDALEKVLEVCRSIKKGRLILVFGCGGDRDISKRPLMGRVASQLADVVVVTSDNPRTEDPMVIISHIMEGVVFEKSNFHIEPCREKAIEKAILEALPQDIVLIAGKGHENYQLIGKEKKLFSDMQVAQVVLERICAAHNS